MVAPSFVDCKFCPENIKQRSLQRLHTKIVVALEDRDGGRTL